MTRELKLEITVSDPYDGAVRLLCDAQRFGFQLMGFSLTPAAEMDTAIIMILKCRWRQTRSMSSPVSQGTDR